MATKVLMEALSPTMEEGRLVEWKKKEGDPVAAGEVLAEVETDKAVMDLQARAAGIMLKHVIAPGTTVPVGNLVGVIGHAGEDISALVAAQPAPVARPVPAAATPSPSGPTARPAPEPGPAAGGRIKASPLARKIAADRGVDLSGVRGSGPEGRIVVRDLDRAPAAADATGFAAPIIRAGSGEPFAMLR